MLLLLLALGVQTVRGEIQRAQYDTFPGKKFPMNEINNLKSEPARSTIQCSSLCLQTACCVAANYDKDAGVCHMFHRNSTMEDSNHTVAIQAEREVAQGVDPLLPWVGLWPLQAAYGGEDLSGNDQHLDLPRRVRFPADDVTPWCSPAAYFPRAYTELGPGVNLESFSWMAKVYIESTRTNYLIDNYNEFKSYITSSGDSYITGTGLTWRVYVPCHGYIGHPAPLSMRTWHTLAATFHFPTGNLTMWMDGTKHESTGTPCESRETPRQLYIGKNITLGVPLHGRMSCLGLSSDVMDYDVMYAATMQHCGG